MISTKLFAVLLATTAVAVPAVTHAAEAKDALAAFHAALVAGDRAKALEQLAPTVTIYEGGYVERSRDEYASHHLGSDMQFAGKSTRKVLQQAERLSGNTAIIWQETETTAPSLGKPVRGTETAILEKNGANWSIVHIHWSSRRP